MESRLEQALANHRKGYNCAQSVACAYCERFGIDESTMLRLTEGFGAGMGGYSETCGALSALILLAGLQQADGNVDAPKSKKSTYKTAAALAEAFRQKNGSTVCRELKGMESGTPLRTCDGCIADAVALAEQILFAE